MSSTMGLPCQHILQQRMRDNEPLQVSDFHVQWRLDRYSELRLPTGFELTQDPQDIRKSESKVPQTKEAAYITQIDDDIAIIEPIRKVNRKRRKAQASQSSSTSKRRNKATPQSTERTFLDETNASEDELLDDLLALDLKVKDIKYISDSDSDSEGSTQ